MINGENLSLIAFGISIISMLGGVFTHYLFVRVKLAVQDEKFKSLVHRMDQHDNLMPEMNEKLTSLLQDVAVIKSRISQ